MGELVPRLLCFLFFWPFLTPFLAHTYNILYVMSGQTLDSREKNADLTFGFFSPYGAFTSETFRPTPWSTEVCVQFPAVPVHTVLTDISQENFLC